MNKIILKGEKTLLDKYTSSAQIIVKENSILSALNLNTDMNLDITLEEGVTLLFNMFNYASDITINISVTSNDNSQFYFNNSFISTGKYELNIDNKVYGSDILTNVNMRGINEENGKVRIEMNGTIAGETKNNVLNEYAKIINKSDYANVLIPNLIVNTNEVEANHGVSVGHISKEEMFYLMSKGINELDARNLLEDGFLLSIYSDEDREAIKQILMGR